jgi:ribokinase
MTSSSSASNDMADRPSIVVIGSVNLDIVASAERLPVAGETVTGAELGQFPGGKGANQALAARRLGADVSLVAAVGDDANAELALALLREGQVDLSACRTLSGTPTGVALIAVSASGENQIVVAPGANRLLTVETECVPQARALIGQLEVPVPTLAAVAGAFEGFVCLNLAPAVDVPESLIASADLIVVNQTEADFYGSKISDSGALVARTLGASGAELYRDGKLLASAASPIVDALDSTGAGDTFTAALTIALVENHDLEAALHFACAAGAAAVTKAGAQPSLPFRHEVEALM